MTYGPRSWHSDHWIMLIGGPAHGEVYRVRPDHLGGMLIVPKPSGPLFCRDDEDPLYWKPPRLEYDRYVEQWFAAPDGWRQLAYVHQDLMSQRLVDDVIPEATIVAAIMEPWRAQHRQKATK